MCTDELWHGCVDPDNTDGKYLKGDQYLLTKYMSRNRNLVAFDTRQDLFATFNINHLKTRRANIKRTCKKSAAPNAPVQYDCLMIYPKMLLVDKAFSFTDQCALSRLQGIREMSIIFGVGNLIMCLSCNV